MAVKGQLWVTLKWYRQVKPMMNSLVFNRNADILQTTIYGVDNDELRPIAVDPDGRFLFSPLSEITVTATNLDIRDLTPSRDTVSVTATDLDIRNLDGAQDSVQKYGCAFVEATITTTAPAGTTAYLVRDIGPYSQNSYFIRNNGASTITVSMQIAPVDDANFYFTAAGPTAVTAGNNLVLSTTTAMRYARLLVQASANTAIVAYYNGRP